MFRSKWTLACCCALLITGLGIQPVYAINQTRPSLTADAAVLMDAISGDVLFDKQAHKQRAPASTTKMMTAILGLELGRPDEIVTVSSKAAAVGESTIHLDPGEKATLYELITGALVKSGNDACVAIGEHIAGTIRHLLY
jgi:D-alanyl-D-alanine carboxypeptidase (penicillin-binding protein 5/6)